MAYAGIAYFIGHADLSEYLLVAHVPGCGELTVLLGALLGASLAFLWYNAPPAQIFMGDVGSLALGGALGFVALVSRTELVLFVVGGVFVAEALSVIIQVASPSRPRDAGCSAARRCIITSSSAVCRRLGWSSAMWIVRGAAGPVQPGPVQDSLAQRRRKPERRFQRSACLPSKLHWMSRRTRTMTSASCAASLDWLMLSDRGRPVLRRPR